ncbi:VTT domain-containing protein [Entamoeba marina]
MYNIDILENFVSVEGEQLLKLFNPSLTFLQEEAMEMIQIPDLLILSLSCHFRLPPDIDSSLIDMLLSYQYTLPVAYITSIILHVYIVLYKYYQFHFQPFKKVHLFTQTYQPFFSSFLLFAIFVPLIPIQLFYILFACLGLPILPFAFAQFLSALPQTYLNVTLGERLTEVDSIRFEADTPFLLLLITSLGLSLLWTVTRTIRILQEDNSKTK